MTKILLIAGGALLLGGSAANCLLARPAEQPSDLTLANLEALGLEKDVQDVKIPCCPAYWFNYCLFPGTMANGDEVNMRVDGAVNC